MTFEEQLDTYAHLIVAHGLNVQAGQCVNISTEAIHRDFALRIAGHAYARGAKYVNIDLAEPRLARMRLLESREADLAYVPGYIGTKYRDLVDEKAANLKLIGSEDPDILADLDPRRVNALRLNHYRAIQYFYDEGVGKSRIHWTVAAAATPKWGQKVFPGLAPDEAERALWADIFKIVRADRADCLEAWKAHNSALQDRARRLSAMAIERIRFTGPGTDLTIGLSPKAVFKGGGDMGPWGVEFEPNLPTEEVFTTPDWRCTEGHVQTTRPFLINGVLIKGLRVAFEQGEIVSFEAEAGEPTFREYIASDPGAKRLGEVALVGIDSPVYQTGRVYEEILFDENAACHIAIGSAYKFCVDGGPGMTKDELAAIGCNESTVHTDMMISSAEVDVMAQSGDGNETALIERGRWII